MSLEAIKERLTAEAAAHGLILDGVFVLDKGWVIDAPKDDALTEIGKSQVANWTARESGTLVFDLLTWLSSVMPETLGRRPLLGAYWQLK